MRHVGTVSRPWLARGFAVAAMTWVLTLVAVPFLLAHERGGRPVTVVSAGTYLVGSVVCHQRPDRSFSPWGVQMPVCARCAGLYMGGALGVALVGVRGARRGWDPGRRRMASTALRWGVLAAAVPTGLTWVGEAAGGLTVTEGVRAVAAVPLGAAVTWVVSLVIRGELA